MTGLGIFRRTRCAEARWTKAFADLSTSLVSDVMHRMDGGGAGLRPMHDGTILCGPAITVRTRPGDNLMIHAAIDRAAPGDVVVVDAGGDLTNALVGELMVTHARKLGIAGFVINGAIRDSADIFRQSLGVYALGVTHRGPFRDGPGTVNKPICLGGMVVHPGDLILGDADGIVAIGIDALESVHAKAAAKLELEARQRAAFEAGIADRSWVDKTLAALNCPVED